MSAAGGRVASAIDARRDRTLVAVLLVVGLALALPGMIKPADPNSDGLFYEAQVQQLRGASENQALHSVFAGPRAREVYLIEDAPEHVNRLLNPRWVHYSSQFFHRRWLVPAFALGVSDVTGASIPLALQDVSMLGYALFAVVCFLLLRRRHSPSVSVVVALGLMAFPPAYRWAFGQFVDSWGVLLETLGLLALLLVADRGARWLPLWFASMLALSITRDATMVLGIAALALLLAQWRDPQRRRLNVLIVVVGALAALPALALGGTPVRENLAYIFNGYMVPADDSWGFVAQHYFEELWRTIKDNVQYPGRQGVLAPYFYLTVLAGLVSLVAVALARARADAELIIAKGAIAGCAVLLLIADNPQGYRLELVFMPVVAIGAAMLIERAAAWAGARSEPASR